jgi:hypothetical protein
MKFEICQKLCCESRLSRPQSRCGAVFLSLPRQYTAVRRGWVLRPLFGFRGRDAGAGCGFGAVRIGAFSLKGKRRFCHYFFNRLEGNFGILLNPKILFSKTKKPFPLSSIVRSLHHLKPSSLLFIFIAATFISSLLLHRKPSSSVLHHK